MSQSDAMNGVDRKFDPAEVATKDEALCLLTALDALNTSESDGETVASQAAPSFAPALARYVIDLGLDQGVNLMIEVRRFSGKWGLRSATSMFDSSQLTNPPYRSSKWRRR